MIRLLNVGCRRDGRHILDAITLHVLAGEFAILEGGRGAGKSTLLRVVAGLTRADEGEVWIAGRDLARLQRSSLPFVRRSVGYLPSDGALLPAESALENVILALGIRGHTMKQARVLAEHALEILGLSRCAGAPAGSLSTSERRLVALARALAGGPKLLVLDDPSAGLAPPDAGRVLSALLDAVVDGATVLCGSADASFASAAVRAGARRVRMDSGRVMGGARPVAVHGLAVAGARSDDERRSAEATGAAAHGEQASEVMARERPKR